MKGTGGRDEANFCIFLGKTNPIFLDIKAIFIESEAMYFCLRVISFIEIKYNISGNVEGNFITVA